MKYRFEIIYQTKWIKQASDFMSKCDLGVGEIGIKETITFQSQKDLIISDIKEKINQAMNESECKLLHIEGGKVE